MRKGGVVVIDERQNCVLKSVQAGEAHPTSHFATQRSKPDFDLIEPRAVAWSKDKLNSVTRVGQKIDASLYRAEDSTNAFLAKRLVDLARFGNVTNQ